MPRFYFTTENGQRIPDREGSELPNQGVARVEAIKLVGELLKEFPERFWETGSFRLRVANGEGLVLFTVTVDASEA